MKKYVCDICGWEYDEAAGDPDHGIAPGTKFEDLPADFVCPLCGVGKDFVLRGELRYTPAFPCASAGQNHKGIHNKEHIN